MDNFRSSVGRLLHLSSTKEDGGLFVGTSVTCFDQQCLSTPRMHGGSSGILHSRVRTSVSVIVLSEFAQCAGG